MSWIILDTLSQPTRAGFRFKMRQLRNARAVLRSFTLATLVETDRRGHGSLKVRVVDQVVPGERLFWHEKSVSVQSHLGSKVGALVGAVSVCHQHDVWEMPS